MPLLQILSLWRRRGPGLAAGLAMSLLAFLAGIALLGVAGLRLAGTGAGVLLVSALLLRLLGMGRVLLRYGERLATHDAMFRALADLRVWFFRRVARSAAAGLGHRRSGDLLSRMVGDVEALDGLYLRIACAAGRRRRGPAAAGRAGAAPRRLAGAGDCRFAFACAAFLLPLLAAVLVRGDAGENPLRSQRRACAWPCSTWSAACARSAPSGPRVAMLAGVQAERGGAIAVAAAAQAGAADRARRRAVVPVPASRGAGGAGERPPASPSAAWGAIDAAVLLFVLIAAFELAGGLTRAGVLAGAITHAAARVVGAGAVGAPGPHGRARRCRRASALRLRDVRLPLAAATGRRCSST